MIDNVLEISRDQLLAEVQNASFNDYRFVTATCVDLGNDTLDVIYHFDKDFELKNFRLNVKKGEAVPSISKIYFCAILVENEMKEMFGLNVENMVLDYGGHMLLSDDELSSPMAKQQIVIERKEAE